MFAESVPHHRRSIAIAGALIVAAMLLAVAVQHRGAHHRYRPHRPAHVVLRVSGCIHSDYVFVIR